MKNLKFYILPLLAVAFSACSSNQELVSLEEYDDVYYQGGSEFTASAAVTSSNDNLNGASNAEQSYYGNAPYNDQTPSPEIVESETTDEYDYYDQDYARRIENFQYSEDGNYAYTDQASNNAVSNSPQVSYNVGMGMSNYGYGSGYSLGVSYGSGYNSPYGAGFTPGFYGGFSMGYRYSPCYSPWYDPFYSPYGYSSFYNPCGSPFYGYNPYNPYFNPYYNPYYNPYAGGGYYGGGYYGGYPDYGSVNGNGISDGSRANADSNTRPSRGGVMTQNDPSGTDPNGLSRNPQLEMNSENELTISGRSIRPETGNIIKSDETMSRVQRSGSTNDYFDKTEAIEFIEPRQRRTDNSSNDTYTRQSNSRNTGISTRSYQGKSSNNSTRNIAPTPRPERSRSASPSDSKTRMYNSTPSRTYDTKSSSPAPSYSSPSRSGGGNNSGGSSRSSSPTRRR